MLLHWSKNWGSVQTCTTEEDDDGDGDRVVDYHTSGMPTLWLPFFQELVELADTTTNIFSATLTCLYPTRQARPPCQRGTT